MKTDRPTPPRDEEVDALLARRYRDTTPEFEARWVALKRELRQTSGRRRGLRLDWRGWLVFAGLTAALAWVVFPPGPRQESPATLPTSNAPALAELLAMDAALAPAIVLLPEENRAMLLNLPIPPHPQL